jgi:PEP-CTERM motif-containing protein
MKNYRKIWLWAMLAGGLSIPAQAGLITNGGFEAGLSAWTKLDQVGSEGTFSLQTGTLSPVNLFAVPAPPGGTRAAMTDAEGPGSHVLYQDFIVPSILAGPYFISFSLYINNNHGSPAFFTPALLDFATPTLNQQARVDIIRPSADPFSVAAGDILQNVYQTTAGNPLVSGYNSILIPVTPLLQANLGQTLRLRFAEVDNVAPFNLGVDNVDINAVPEPSSWIMTFGALLVAVFVRRRNKSGHS